MLNRIKIISYLISFSFLLYSCDEKPKSGITNPSFLPKASGENNEMLIIMDSTKFKGKIGRELVDIYSSSVNFRFFGGHFVFFSRYVFPLVSFHLSLGTFPNLL